MAADDSASLFGELISWVVQHGGYIHPDLRFSPASTAGDASGSSLITTAEIPQDTEILRCPHSCAISIGKAHAGFPQQFVDAVTPHALLCFFVAKQRLLGDESFWAPYIRVLPKQFDTLLYFDDEDFKFLEGCNLGRQDAEKRRAEWKAEWKTGLKALEVAGEDAKPYTWDLILWAATVLTTRSFLGSLLRPTTSAPRPSDSHPVLFPLVDSLNHRPLTPITWRPTDATLSLHPNTAIPANSELYNNYGPKPNAELLMGYGFTIPNNPCDTLPLLFNPPLSPAQQEVRNLQPRLENNDGQYVLAVNTSPLFPDTLTSLFRLLTAIPSEIPLLKSNPAGQITVRNELATYSQLIMAMRLKLNSINKDIPEPRNYRQTAAKIYRDGQRDIIRAAENEAATKLSTLYHSGITDGTLVSLSTALEDAPFAEAVEACFGASDVETLEQQDQEDIIFVLYLCWKYLVSKDEKWRGWFQRLEKEKSYGSPQDEADEGVDEIFEAIFPAAAEEAPEVFGDEGKEGKWSERLLSWGLKVFQGEGINVPDAGEIEEAIYVIELRP